MIMADIGARNNTASACETSHWLLRETLPRLLKRPPRRCEVCARILEAEPSITQEMFRMSFLVFDSIQAVILENHLLSISRHVDI